MQKERPSSLGALAPCKDRVNDEDWGCTGGLLLRMVCGMFRDCKRSKKKRRVCLTKADIQARADISAVLANIDVLEEEDDDKDVKKGSGKW